MVSSIVTNAEPVRNATPGEPTCDITPHRSYPGGKAGDGVYQTIINQFPPHENYIELFGGAGTIIKRKRPATGLNIIIEIDGKQSLIIGPPSPAQVFHGSAFHFLFHRRNLLANPTALFYADPPYPLSTRKTRRYYANELTDDQHAELLRILSTAKAMVAISGYRCPLYDSALTTWRRIDYTTMTRGGTPRTESLWMNYPEPATLHDYSYLGKTFRDRERINRLISRWTRRFQAMPTLQRAALLEALLETQATPPTMASPLINQRHGPRPPATRRITP